MDIQTGKHNRHRHLQTDRLTHPYTLRGDITRRVSPTTKDRHTDRIKQPKLTGRSYAMQQKVSRLNKARLKIDCKTWGCSRARVSSLTRPSPRHVTCSVTSAVVEVTFRDSDNSVGFAVVGGFVFFFFSYLRSSVSWLLLLFCSCRCWVSLLLPYS